MNNEYYENLPKRESMRAKLRNTNSWDDYYDHYNKEAWTWITKFLEDSVGKNFSDIYSKVCNKFKKDKDFEFRNKFKSRIDPHDMSEYSYNKYYLDSDNIIRKYKPIKRNKRKKFVFEVENSNFYIVNKENLAKYPDIIAYLISKLGKESEYNIMSSYRLSKEFGEKVRNTIYEALSQLNNSNKNFTDYLKISDFIKEYCNAVTYYKGSPEYSKHYYEEKSAKRKRMREYRKEKELVRAQIIKDSLIRANAEKQIRKNTHESD